MNAQAQLHDAQLHRDMAVCRRAGVSYELAAEAQRQRKEEQQAAYESALDAEIEAIWADEKQVQEALGYTLDQAGMEHAVVMSVMGSKEQRERWNSVLRQHVADAVCELARANLASK